jgi:hypothetical protein
MDKEKGINLIDLCLFTYDLCGGLDLKVQAPIQFLFLRLRED